MSDATEGIRDDLVYDLARTVYPPTDGLRDRLAEVLAPLWPVTMSRNVAHHRDQILAAADALVPVVQAALTEQTQRAEQAEARLAELESAITWETSCLSCARVLDSSYADHTRAEQAERERDKAIAALTRHAAEAHGRKWAHSEDNQTAFDALHRLGAEILASRDRLIAASKQLKESA